MQIKPPIRVSRQYTQRLRARPAEVFPLLCPVREVEWVNGWEPNLVISASGAAELHCIFTIEDHGEEATWVVTAYEPDRWKISFMKFIPAHTVGIIEIELAEESGDTLANIRYTYTAIGSRGEKFVRDFTEDFYRSFMMEWENELNHFLKTGRKLPRS